MGGFTTILRVMRCVVLAVVILLLGCNSRKKILEEQIRNNVRLEVELNTRLKTQLRVLELLDVDFRQVEQKDSNGNVRTETDVKLHRNTKTAKNEDEEVKENRQEEDKSQSNRQEEDNRKNPLVVWGIVALLVLLVLVVVGSWVYLRRRIKTR